ncbi:MULTISPECIES: acetate/propionate family kinase [unclassified Adlercreutzia]|uniref:acetate/propionate family kinase n=1 Tax=unclassified Adlercreutzia TaxID=2636013 RepID=UPI0013EC3805|nr:MULTISPECIES: acetate kinase [unclassified Adlercreutzia]
MLVLVVNAGSSSLKSQLIETEGKDARMKCLAEKVGTERAFMNVSFAPDFQKVTYNVAGLTVEQCLRKLLDIMVDDPESPISGLDQIDAIGNRIVAGGEFFTKATLIDDEARANLAKCEELAPLHNPPADACIDMTRNLLPNTPQVAVFDTAFHQTMPPKAYMYPLPMRYYDEYSIRRYGAHGTSHRYAAQQAANLLGRPLRDLGLITCHLGNGGSITAVNHGKSIDTTMGFTPLEGLMMGTRSGSIDPAIITYIMRREGITFDEMDEVLNRKSGILGIAGSSGDMRDVLDAAARGDEHAELAIDMYVYRVQKAIGSYYAAMTRTDAVVMTAGIGENSADLRERIFRGLAHMGMILDKERNNVEGAIGMNRVISIDDSPIKICVVTTDEEMRIARETDNLVSQLR